VSELQRDVDEGSAKDEHFSGGKSWVANLALALLIINTLCSVVVLAFGVKNPAIGRYLQGPSGAQIFYYFATGIVKPLGLFLDFALVGCVIVARIHKAGTRVWLAMSFAVSILEILLAHHVLTTLDVAT